MVTYYMYQQLLHVPHATTMVEILCVYFTYTFVCLILRKTQNVFYPSMAETRHSKHVLHHQSFTLRGTFDV